MAQNNKVTIQEAKIVLRNFAGLPDKYTTAGDRNFCVLLDPESAEAMKNDGWNVKFFKQKPDDDPNEPPQAYLRVKVSYKSRPPVIVVITTRADGSKVRRNYNEELVELLDAVDIQNVDLMISPYRWEVGENSGVKAYLDSMYITINQNELEEKYSDVEYEFG